MAKHKAKVKTDEEKTKEFNQKRLVGNNKKAFHNYDIQKKVEAGIVLTGSEAKSLTVNQINLKGSFVSVFRNEMFLELASIPVYREASWTNHEEKRKRKLLLHKKEIEKFGEEVEQKGMSIVPIKMYQIQGKYKLEIGLGKGKKIYDKRETLKQRDQERETQHFEKIHHRKHR